MTRVRRILLAAGLAVACAGGARTVPPRDALGAAPELPPVPVATESSRAADGTESASSSAERAPPPASSVDDVHAPLRVGVLHSLSGTMAREETRLKDVVLMTLEDINRAGGVLGRKIEPVVVDPASNWPLFAEKADQLLRKDGARVVFGAHTSVSRRSVLPPFEELGGLLFYPAQYEGEAPSKAVFYTGAVPNQSVNVVAGYLLGRGVKAPRRWFVLGTDYSTARTQDRALRNFLKANGVAEADIVTRFTPFGHDDYREIVASIRKLSAAGRTAVFGLLYFESAIAFQKEIVAQGLAADRVQVVSFGVDELTLAGKGVSPFAGHLVARSYFSTLENERNLAFKARWAEYVRTAGLPGEQSLVLNDEMEAAYVGVQLWKQAVEAAGSLDTARVTAALAGRTFPAPSGFTLRVDDVNHHLHKPYFVGKVDRLGRVSVVWSTPGTTPPDVTVPPG